ncbi:hypothetical protein [Aestuariivirga sp.]|uniref:hypothetical protein n=1 Tax=Aestuariivirga sp. TaxID=2650926 RepID=UPI003BAD9D56
MNLPTELSETAIRKRALSRGYRVFKSRQQEHCNNRGHYMLCENNIVVMGDHFDATLEEVAEYLSDKPTGIN